MIAALPRARLAFVAPRGLVSGFVLMMSASLVGCAGFIGGGMKDRLLSAPVSPNPLGKGSLQSTPIATGKNGQMYRIVTADPEEVCINGEVPGDPADIQKVSFVLSSHRAADDVDMVPTVKSKKTTPLNSTGASTQFQACFDNREGILTDKTVYLLVRPDMGIFSAGAAGAWHFDDEIRGR